MATVLVDRGYGTTFNTPRHPRTHTIVRSRFSGGLRHLWQPLDGVGLWNPFGNFDLVHSFNKVPLWSNQPWMLTFESIVPRTLGRHQEILRDVLRTRLLAPQCSGIIAISDYAIRRTKQFLAGWERLPELLSRIEVIPPNLQPLHRRSEYTGGPLSLLFIGHDFARKGGIVTLRMAKLAQACGLPLHFHIISNLHYGKGVYTDFQDTAAYAEDMKLLTLPNVTHHGSMPNAAVMQLIEDSHFVLLPTLHDTYGYSPLEGMSLGVPAIASATAAIPEFVKDGENGFLLPLPNDDIGEWIHLRKLPIRWADLDEAYDSLARSALARLSTVIDNPQLWDRLSDGAFKHIVAHHDAAIIAAILEQRYSAALAPAGIPRTA
jgi:glycosyltransferase involved in cell wall biosynthesis